MNRILLTLAVLLGCCMKLPGSEARPLKVFLMIGQSNMQGHAHVRTLPHLEMDLKTRPILDKIVAADGTPAIHEKVWISYLSNGGVKSGPLTVGYGANDDKIGPELTFGVFIQEMLDEPVLIIKAAWGGKSLHTDFRPPSSGAYEFRQAEIEQLQRRGKDVDLAMAEKAAATGHFYRLTIQHIQQVLDDLSEVYPNYNPQHGYELAGCVWFQGWNDMVDRNVYPDRDQPGGYDVYSQLLASFIRDLRVALSAPDLPFVIGVMGVGGPVDDYQSEQKRYATVHQNFRDAMAAPASLPEFKDNVVAVLTENYWDSELSELRSREAALKQKLNQLGKEQQWSRAEKETQQAAMYRDEFSERESKLLKLGISNAEYHYLGSAKIMAQIGKGFAEAMLDLRETP